MTDTNKGHGHVTPRADGVKARCGGPAFCKVCKAEQAALAQPVPVRLTDAQKAKLARIGHQRLRDWLDRVKESDA
jgi:hypothetical protein